MAKSNDKGGGARNRLWCQAYRNRGQRELNKVKRLLRHFRRNGFRDAVAVHAYNSLPMTGKPVDLRSVSVERP